MAKVNVDKLSGDVAVILGECLQEDSDVYESPFPRLKDRVRIVAPGILTRLIADRDEVALDSYEILASEAEADLTGVTEIPIPDDFLRLCAVKMDDWHRPVMEVEKADDINSCKQTSRWAGIRGNPSRPVVIESFESGGKRCLRLFSSAPGTKLSYALYWRRPDWDAGNNMEIPAMLYPGLVRAIAEELRGSL